VSVYPRRFPLNLVFRGNRDYIQGADVYEAVVATTQGACGPVQGPLTLRMHSLARAGCELLLAPADVPVSRPELGKAEFVFGNWHGWIVETGRPVVGRLPYDEGHISRQCEITGSIIRTIGKTPNSAIEVLIGAAKLLHQSLYPQVERKWIVSRIELQRVFSATDFVMEVELLQNLNHRLTRSAIRCETEPLGHIFFSAIES
jgi:hypothetical protein